MLKYAGGISDHVKESKVSRIFIVDGNIDLRFAVTGEDEAEAKRNAERLIKKILDTEVLGTFGWTLKIKDVKEARPVEKKA